MYILKVNLINVYIHLKQNNVDKLEEFFWAVSTPGNKQYGKFMSQSQVAELVAPELESVSRFNFINE